jgi:hypothetical protein
MLHAPPTYHILLDLRTLRISGKNTSYKAPHYRTVLICMQNVGYKLPTLSSTYFHFIRPLLCISSTESYRLETLSKNQIFLKLKFIISDYCIHVVSNRILTS